MGPEQLRRRGGVTMVVHCACGTDVEADSDDALIAYVEAHIAVAHPEKIGTYSRVQILGLAERSQAPVVVSRQADLD